MFVSMTQQWLETLLLMSERRGKINTRTVARFLMTNSS